MTSRRSLPGRVHLGLGLFAGVFLAMYAAGLVWPVSWTLVSDRQVPIAVADTNDPRAIARTVRRLPNGFDAELVDVTRRGDEIELRLAWPGAEHLVTYRTGGDTARVRTRTVGVAGALNRIHRVSGLWHESGWLNAWGVVVAAMSVALLGLGISGIWQWYARGDDRLPGSLVLGIGLLVGIGLAIALRAQG